MVLPAPAAPPAQGPAERGWIEQLVGTLGLLRRGALVLVDHARPEALGTLVRGLLPRFPDVEVHTRAADVLSSQEGSTIVWWPDPREAERVNLERPLFADRALKVVMFSPKRTSDVYARRAPDFFSWVARYVECPAAPHAPAVNGLSKAALCAEALGVRWTGGDLDSAFSHAFPGEALARLSGSIAYDEMVKAAAETPSFIAWQDVDGPYRLRRITWAAAEAKRAGRVILERPTVASPGFWPVSGHAVRIGDARDTLQRAGAVHPGRLSALLDLEPEALRLAAAWLRSGGEAREIEERLSRAEDGGAEAARMALERGLVPERPTPPVLRAIGGRALRIPQDDVRERLSGPPGERGTWPSLAGEALAAGDSRIALFWAQRALTEDEDVAHAKIEWALSLFTRGLTRQAVDTLEPLARRTSGDLALTATIAGGYLAAFRARLRTSTAEDLSLLQEMVRRTRETMPRTGLLVRLLQTLGHVQSQNKDFDAASRSLEEALRLERDLPHGERWGLLTSRHGLAMVSRSRGDLGEAEVMARSALDETRTRYGREHPHVATCLQGLGTILLAREDPRAALPYLERALALKQRLYGDEHPSTASAYHELGKAWTALGDFERAEKLLDLAREHRLASLGEKSLDFAETLDAIGRLEQKQGRHVHAEGLFREATEIRATALGTSHPETLESVQGLSAVAGEEEGRRTAIEGFLDDLPKRTRLPAEEAGEVRAKGLYTVRRALMTLRLIDEAERSGGTRARTIQGVRWLVFKPLTVLAAALDQAVGLFPHPPTGGSGAAVSEALSAVYAAALATAARRRNAPDLCRKAIERARAAFGPDHPFTREVETTLTGQAPPA